MRRSSRRSLFSLKVALLLLFLLLSLSLLVSGDEEHVLLKDLQGDVQHRGSEFFHAFEPAQEGMAIYPGETIRVGLESSAEILFPDGATILLKAGTEVRIHTDQVGELELRVLQVDEGEVVVKHDEGLLDRVIFEVETPSAIAAVRGTIFRIRTDEWMRTTASVLEGTLAVSSHNPSTVILTAGMMTYVDPNEDPAPPFPLTDDEQGRWDEDWDWISDEEEDEDLEERIQEFYQDFVKSYEEKSIESLLDSLAQDWTSSTGDSVESLREWLTILFEGYDTFTVEIQLISIQEEEEDLVSVLYSISILSLIEEYGYEHREEGIVEELLLIDDEIKILYSSME